MLTLHLAERIGSLQVETVRSDLRYFGGCASRFSAYDN